MVKKITLVLVATMLTIATTTAQTSSNEHSATSTPVVTSAPLNNQPINQYADLPSLKNSVYAGWGFLPATDFVAMFAGIFTGMFSPLSGYVYKEYQSDLSAWFIGYERRLTDWLTLGIDYTYSNSTTIYKDNTEQGRQDRYLPIAWNSVMANGKIVWWGTPSFKIYSRLALGISIISRGTAYDEDGTKIEAADGDKLFIPFAGAQISVLGLEIGRKFAFFVEPIATAGWQGTMLTAGFKLNF